MSTGKGNHLIYAADLFCGAGGFSAGLLEAAEACGLEVNLLAVNHWDIAIASHSLNHPGVEHLCQAIEGINPRVAVPGGKLRLMIGSPECTHFSGARGGKPMSDQSRASAWCILRWLEALEVDCVILENVPEFATWGPLHPCTCGTADPRTHLAGFKCHRPIEKQKGKFFRLFIRNLKALGYRVDWRTLVAANYGDATTRERLFIIARKDRKPIIWPEPTHVKEPETVATAQRSFSSMSRSVDRWRPARDVIDWTIPGVSIYLTPEEARAFRVKRPLAGNTLRRIFAGLVKYSGLPFLLPHQHGSSSDQNVRSVDAPFPTITGTSSDLFLAEPFLVVLRRNQTAQSVDEPLRTLTTSGATFGLIEPCLVGISLRGGNGGYIYGADRPLPTVTTQAELGLVQPLLAAVNHGPDASRFQGLDAPLPTMTGKGTWGLAEPCVLVQQSGSALRLVSEPLPTVAGAGAISLIESWMVDFYGERKGQDPRCRSIDEPMPTVAGSRTHGLCSSAVEISSPFEPWLVEYYGNGGAHSITDPMPTITTRDRLALVHPELVRTGQISGLIIGWLDIKFRMLQPHELAGAMSFPKHYVFNGSREQQVKQIGNAVPVRTARALCEAVLGGAA